MKKLKVGLVLLGLVAMTGIANAGGVGYIDYAKVIDNFDYAKKATKEVDAKVGAEVESYFDGLTFKYQAAETLNEVFVVSWVWAFEQGHDVEDTKLGKGEGDASLQFDLSITFTQIQDETL